MAKLKPEEAGERIGSYKLLEQIGEGGFGIVWMAEQEQPVRRRVALKIIKVGMDTKQVIARFEQERQALAMMEHPNIAKVFDAGSTPFGRPFFVMELVRGIPITEYCDEARLTMRQRLELFVRVCHAVQHAHQKGVIHRDLKPTNVLVTMHDGVPVPKVIDFGVAKATQQRLTELTLFTGYEQMVGTPLYMSPEQAEMSGLDIDTRSDIYALGVMLYEILTGRTPLDADEFRRHGYDEMRRVIREEEPARPSIAVRTMAQEARTRVARFRESEAPHLVHALEGDLDWIVMKALEKDRNRRYETANGLAMDIQRHLDGEAVLARPPTRRYRLQKLFRRHRGEFAAATLIAAALFIGLGISIWQAVRATHAEQVAKGLREQEAHLRERAEREGAAARLNEYVADIALAAQSLNDGNYRRAVSLLEKHRPKPGKADLRGFEWRYLWQLAQGEEQLTLPVQEGPVQSIAFSPRGDNLAMGLQKKLTVWNTRAKSMSTVVTQSREADEARGPGPAGGGASMFSAQGFTSIAFSPDERMLMTAGPRDVRVWSCTDWHEGRSLPEVAAPLARSPEGERLATTQRTWQRERRTSVVVWDTRTWSKVTELPGATSPMAFSPDGTRLATAGEGGITLRRLDGAGAEVVLAGSTSRELRGGPDFLTENTVAFSPDGKWVVAARNAASERGVFVRSIWDANTGAETGMLPSHPQQIEHTGVISAVVFSPDGSKLATGSLDHSIRLWDLARRERIGTLHGHLAEVWALAFSPDGRTLASGAKDGSVKLWSMDRLEKGDEFQGALMPLAFSKDGRSLVAIAGQETIGFFNSETGAMERGVTLDQMGTQRRGERMEAFTGSADLRVLVQGFADGTVQMLSEGIEPRILKASTRPIELVALSPDGGSLITGGREEDLRWWTLRAGTSEPWPVRAIRVQFSPEGSTVAVFPRGELAELWDTATRKLRVRLEMEAELSNSAAFSADGRLLAMGWKNDTIRLWDVRTGALLGTFSGHKQPVFSIAFSPDGRTLASASDDSTLRLWNVATQQEFFLDRRLGESLGNLQFSPDGRLLVGGRRNSAQTRGLRTYRAPLLSETDEGVSLKK